MRHSTSQFTLIAKVIAQKRSQLVSRSSFRWTMLQVMKRQGKYVSSGAIAGPLVELDIRVFYLKDLTLIGCTGRDEPAFPNLVSYIERGEIRPLVAKTFPLREIVLAQQEFLERKHFGNFVLIPPTN